MAHPALTTCRAFLQLAATAAMHCHPEGCTHPPPLAPPFLLAQNLSSKQIGPTDNMRPKSDAKKRHWWLNSGLSHEISIALSMIPYVGFEIRSNQWTRSALNFAELFACNVCRGSEENER